MLCTDLPDQSWLKAGAKYRLLGGKNRPELMKDPSYFADDLNDISRFELDSSSKLYELLHNSGSYPMSVTLENDLICTGAVECALDTVRLVKVDSVFYEFVERRKSLFERLNLL